MEGLNSILSSCAAYLMAWMSEAPDASWATAVAVHAKAKQTINIRRMAGMKNSGKSEPSIMATIEAGTAKNYEIRDVWQKLVR